MLKLCESGKIAIGVEELGSFMGWENMFVEEVVSNYAKVRNEAKKIREVLLDKGIIKKVQKKSMSNTCYVGIDSTFGVFRFAAANLYYFVACAYHGLVRKDSPRSWDDYAMGAELSVTYDSDLPKLVGMTAEVLLAGRALRNEFGNLIRERGKPRDARDYVAPSVILFDGAVASFMMATNMLYSRFKRKYEGGEKFTAFEDAIVFRLSELSETIESIFTRDDDKRVYFVPKQSEQSVLIEFLRENGVFKKAGIDDDMIELFKELSDSAVAEMVLEVGEYIDGILPKETLFKRTEHELVNNRETWQNYKVAFLKSVNGVVYKVEYPAVRKFEPMDVVICTLGTMLGPIAEAEEHARHIARIYLKSPQGLSVVFRNIR